MWRRKRGNRVSRLMTATLCGLSEMLQPKRSTTHRLYGAKNCHVDVVTSIKGLSDARHFCYSCHEAFSTVEHCAASGCVFCRQPGYLNRTGFINLSPMNITTLSSSQSSFQGKPLQFQGDRC